MSFVCRIRSGASFLELRCLCWQWFSEVGLLTLVFHRLFSRCFLECFIIDFNFSRCGLLETLVSGVDDPVLVMHRRRLTVMLDAHTFLECGCFITYVMQPVSLELDFWDHCYGVVGPNFFSGVASCRPRLRPNRVCACGEPCGPRSYQCVSNQYRFGHMFCAHKL